MSSLNDGIIRDIVRRIVDTAQPEKVILFGSQARGDARPNSDFDVLVIKPSDEPRYLRSIPLYVALADHLLRMQLAYDVAKTREHARGISIKRYAPGSSGPESVQFSW